MTEYKAIPLNDKYGYGTMSLTWTQTPQPTEKSIESIKHAVDKHGVTFLNGGEFYGPDDANLKLIQQFLANNEDEINEKLVISIKGGFNFEKFAPEGDKEAITKSIDNILTYFPHDKPNRPKLLYEIARRDFEVPYDETIGYIAEYVKAGKLDGLSLSEVGVESIQKASSVFPVSFVELELSILSPDLIYNGVLAELAKQQIPIIAYSPVARGYLTDHCVETADTYLESFGPGDVRSHIDKFTPENFKHNMVLVKKLYDFAHNEKNTSLESLALSWVVKLSQLPEYAGIKNLPKIIPIPSGSTTAKIDRNFGSIIELSDDDLAYIDGLVKEIGIKGLRTNAMFSKYEFA